MFGKLVNKDLLSLYLNDEEIIKYYFPEYEGIGGGNYNSPFSFREDGTPSLSFIYSDDNKLIWKDFGFAEQESTDWLGFVTYILYGEEAIENHIECRKKAEKKIWDDLVIKREGDFNKEPKRRSKNIKSFRRDDKYTYEASKLTDRDARYWYDFGISLETLHEHNVLRLDALYANYGDNYKMFEYSEEEPKFLYLFDVANSSFKMYNPLASDKANKFRSQNIQYVIEGFEQLPHIDEDIIITSSLKDTMVLKECGYNAINPTSENSWRVLIKLFRKNLLKRFKNFYVLFDSDDAGYKAAERLHEYSGYRIKPIFIEEEYGTKDPADFVKAYGKEKLTHIISELIKSINQNKKSNYD